MKTTFLVINLLGMLFGIPLAVLGLFGFLDPITLLVAGNRPAGVDLDRAVLASMPGMACWLRFEGLLATRKG